MMMTVHASVSDDATTAATHQLTYRFDRSFIADGLKRDFAWKGFYLLVILIVVEVAVVSIMGGSWGIEMVGIVAGAAVLIAVLLVFKFRSSVRRVYDFWKVQSPSGELRFSADPVGLTVQTDQANSAYEWSDLRRLWRYSDVWLFEVVRNVSVMFPCRAAPDAMKDYMVERCRAAGVRT